MSDLDILLHQLASQWGMISGWGFPVCWVALGTFAIARQKRCAGWCLILAGGAMLLFYWLFADGSWFTNGWETDAPTSVAFSYKPLGYLAANLLPAVSDISLVLGLWILAKERR